MKKNIKTYDEYDDEIENDKVEKCFNKNKYYSHRYNTRKDFEKEYEQFIISLCKKDIK